MILESLAADTPPPGAVTGRRAAGRGYTPDQASAQQAVTALRHAGRDAGVQGH